MFKKRFEKLLQLNRYTILGFFVLILIFLMSSKLFHLTIVKGNYYREISENKRVKDIIITAQRGEIRDKNGILIAGNKPVFTVQLLKDEIERQKTEVKNDSFLKLVRFIEEDGVNYNDDFPIELNVFKYKNQSNYINSEITPVQMAINIIMENNLLPEILDTYYKSDEFPEHYSFFTINSLITALDTTGEGIPINVSLKNNALNIEYFQGDETKKWKSRNNIDDSLSPKEAILSLTGNNQIYVKKILDDPIARTLVFDIIKSKGLESYLTLEEYSNKYYDNYIKNKISLMRSYPSINLQSSAKEDFITIFKANSLKNLLQREVDESKENYVFPGGVLVEILNRKNKDLNLKAEVVNLKPKYYFDDEEKRDAFDYIFEKANEPDILNEFIESPSIKTLAQNQLIEDGINTGISVAKEEFEYVNLMNYEGWLQRHKIGSELPMKEVFEKVREKYGISSEISRYEARGIMNLYNELSKQGSLGYIPINFAYKIKDKTVAKISENLSQGLGINISSEPIRFYPLGKSSAHILGYIGKIAMEQEVKEYIDKKGYERNALIGKTGIEQNYEDYLKGENGKRKVEVDNVGNTTKVLSEVKPIPGNNVYLSIDILLQQKTEQALDKVLGLIRSGGTFYSKWGDFTFTTSKDKGRPYSNATSGAVMVVDVKTGKILTMANYPSYDPNLFATGISTVDWESLIPKEEKDPLAPRPLYNISLQTAVQPGSIFKMITGLTALEKGLSPEEKIMDGGYVEVDGSVFSGILWKEKQMTLGPINLYEAIKDSVNYYFYSLALGEDQRRSKDIGVKITTEEIATVARKFGLGEPTGIEIKTPQEAKGNVPEPAVKTETIKQLLKNYLTVHIDKYYIGQEELTDEFKNRLIESVVDFVSLKEIPDRKKTIEMLVELNLDPDKKIEGSNKSLADLVKYDYLNQSKWNIADTLNVTIGQGANSYTLAQMVRYVMTLVNGGENYKLSIVNDILDYENKNLVLKRKTEGEKIQLNDLNHLKDLMLGMKMASLSSVNAKVFENFPIEVGVKTGTAERSGINPYTGDTYDSFSWEVGFAPYDNPEIAVACVFFQGGPGSNASPLLREVFAQYFGLNKEQEINALPIETQIVP